MEIIGTAEEIYEQHSVPAILARWAPELVDLAGLRAGERVLDVACGTGIVARQLPDRVGSRGWVVGLDLWLGALARHKHSLGGGETQPMAVSLIDIGNTRRINAVVL